MQIENITWDPRFQTKSIKPAPAYKELEKIRKGNNGKLTPGAVVDASVPKKAVLHPAFTWDDYMAAQKYREDEARTLIASLRVQYKQPSGKSTEPVRALQVEYKQPKNTGGATYAPTSELLSRRDTRDTLLLDALRELAAFRRKYALLSELALLIPVIDEQIEHLREAVGSE